jgi:hypothetical protein
MCYYQIFFAQRAFWRGTGGGIEINFPITFIEHRFYIGPIRPKLYSIICSIQNFIKIRSVILVKFTHRPDDGGSTDLWNVGKLIPVYTVLKPRRRPSLILEKINHAADTQPSAIRLRLNFIHSMKGTRTPTGHIKKRSFGPRPSCAVTPCCLTDGYRHFEGTCHLHSHSRKI